MTRDERRYAALLRQRYWGLDLAAIAPPAEERLQDLQLRDVFLPQDVREDSPDELLWDRRWFAVPQRRPVLDVLREPANRRTVLLGDPGAGKSALARYLLFSLLDPPRESGTGKVQDWIEGFSGYLPLLIEIPELMGERSRGRCETLGEFLAHLGRTSGYELEERWLANRLHAGPAFVLFDGLDEICAASDRERVMREIVGFCCDYPRAWVVVTSRPGEHRDTLLRSAGFRHFILQSLDDRQVERFVRGWFGLAFPGRPEEAAPCINRLLTACEHSRSVRLLAGNPMLLTILAMVARHEELPSERARLYEHLADRLCRHWDVNRQLREAGFEHLGLDKEELLRRVAGRVQSAKHGLAGNVMDGAELQAELEAYLTERYLVSPAEAQKLTLALIEQLHSRHLILRHQGSGLYGFVHRAFLEYLCAADLTRRVDEDPSYPIETLIDEVVAKHWQEAAWHEVLRLVCGRIGEAYAGKIIEYLTLRANPSWRADSEETGPRHLVLATRCLAQVRNRFAIEQTCVTLLQEIVRAMSFSAWLHGWESWPHELTEELPSAAEEVGSNWPGMEGFRTHVRAEMEEIYQPFKSAYMRMCLLGAKDDFRRQLEVLSVKGYSFTRSAALEALARGWPQEPAIRELLQQRENQDADVRRIALAWLARTWPQEPAVRERLQRRALQDKDAGVRRDALAWLVHIWPHEPGTRELLQRRALQDKDADARREALDSLARTWPHEPGIRELLRQRALRDRDAGVRGHTLAALARSWPHEPAIRELLQQRALQDKDVGVRRDALDSLARRWPQEPAIRELLQQRALQDDNAFVRSEALASLARSWPQEPAICELLQQRALQDDNAVVRSVALGSLARTWPHEPGIRELLQNRALQDEAAFVRSDALSALARAWPQEMAVGECLQERALQDDDKSVRFMAVHWLARTWPHEPAVRKLLQQLALQDEDTGVRDAALNGLARTWPHEPAIREFLQQRALEDEDAGGRHTALRGLVQTHEHEMDTAVWSVLSYDRHFRSPLLDLREPISAEHIQETAEHFEISLEEMEKRLAEYSRVLGWDLRKGLRGAA